MLRVIVAGLAARPLRLLLSAVAIALAVAFVAGSFVLGDAVGAGLRDAVAYRTRGVDVSLTPSRGGPALDAALLRRVRRVDGVAAAEARETVSAPLRDAEGRASDAAATGLPADERMRPFDLATGRLPRDTDEVAMDREAAEKAGTVLGRRVTLFDQEGRRHAFTLVGTVSQPPDARLLGSAQLVLRPEALRALAPREGFGEITVRAAPGVSQARLADDLSSVLPKGVSARTGRQVAGELLSSTAPDSGGLTTFFTAFAVLALVVSAMVINNSFTILVAQRARELALLRCVGAARRQVFGMVLGEAVAVGAVASLVGLAGGLGVAAALQTVAGSLNGGASTVHLPLTARTVVASLAIGVLVTALAALLPARAATRVSPVEALRTPAEGAPAGGRTSRFRAVAALTLLAVGAGAAVLGLRADVDDGAVLLCVSMVAVLVAVLAAGPLLVGPAVRTLAMLTRPLLGAPARLAALNAGHNPKRTAATAAALTVGLTVVSLVTTVTAGVEAGQGRALEQQMAADFTVSSVVADRPLPATLPRTLDAVPGVAVAAPRTSFTGELSVGAFGMTAVRGDAVGSVVRPVVLAGRLDRLRPGELAVSRELAEQTGLAVGRTVEAGPRGHRVRLRVVAVYDGLGGPGTDLGLGLVDLSEVPALSAPGGTSYDDGVLVELADGADPERVRPALDKALSAAPLAQLHSVADLKEQLAAPLRGTLALLWALTALAVLIAFAGIANTLSLSVLERTRESALLRALGLTRGGLKAALTAESVFVAVLGALSGMLLGVGSGWLIGRVAATDAEPVPFTLPLDRLGVLFLAALLAAPLAALAPARRAARQPLTAAMAE